MIIINLILSIVAIRRSQSSVFSLLLQFSPLSSHLEGNSDSIKFGKSQQDRKRTKAG